MQHVSHVLITGGGTGIGLAIARGFAAAGAHVTLIGRKSEVLAAACASLLAEFPSAQIGTQTADVTDEAQVRAAFAAAHEQFGAITALVNNAGQALSAPLVKTDLAHAEC